MFEYSEEVLTWVQFVFFSNIYVGLIVFLFHNLSFCQTNHGGVSKW